VILQRGDDLRWRARTAGPPVFSHPPPRPAAQAARRMGRGGNASGNMVDRGNLSISTWTRLAGVSRISSSSRRQGSHLSCPPIPAGTPKDLQVHSSRELSSAICLPDSSQGCNVHRSEGDCPCFPFLYFLTIVVRIQAICLLPLQIRIIKQRLLRLSSALLTVYTVGVQNMEYRKARQ